MASVSCDIKRSHACIERSFITSTENTENVIKYEKRLNPGNRLTGAKPVSRVRCTECRDHDANTVSEAMAAFAITGL